ncbi:Tif3p [Sporobolomyces koalae]|uniref:Tif3p n=1 Tax=Sporobolomyces koalae TaxID=500713 RepID=UPI003180B36E
MPPKKQKAQKMDLSAFLADENTGGSWADEMDTLPTGPSGAGADMGGVGLGGSHLSRNMQGRDGPGGFGARDRYDDGRPQRIEVPIPTEPPYTAFVGNLTFEVIEADLEDFFTGLSVKSVRLVSGQDGKPRGIGYVEFETVEDLKNALTLSGQDLAGRVVRISVAEARAARTGRADEATSWERTGPLPSLGGGGRSGGFGAPRSGGFERQGGGFDDVERDGPIRGGKFVPSAPAPDRGFGGGFASGGPRPDRGPGFSGFERAPPVEIEREGPIRGGKFTPSQPEAPRRTFEPSRADEGPWARGGALPPPPAGSERRGFGSGFSRENSSSEIPIARRPLQLSARSASTTAIAPSSTPVSPSASATPKSNPFGNAKPIDTATKEKEVADKLEKQRQEQAAIAQKEREERELAKKESQDKKEGDSGKSDGDWVRKGPLPPSTHRQNSGGKKPTLAPPVPIVSATTNNKDQPPHAAKPAPWGSKKTDSTDDITRGVEQTKI